MKPLDFRHPWTTGLMLVSMLLLLIPAFWNFQRAAIVIADYPWQLDREEGFLLQQALDLKAGRTIYPNLTDYPFTVGNYPPVYPVVYTAFLFLGQPGLWQGRLIVLLSAFAIVGLAGWLVWRESQRLVPAILTPLLFLVTWNWNNWIVFARVDIPAIALGLAGLVVITGPKAPWRPWVAGALFVLAVYTKQTQVIAPLAALVMLWWRGDRRLATLMAGGMAGAGLVGLGILTLLTSNQFWLHTVTYNANIMEWDKLHGWAGHVTRFSGEKALIAAIGLIVLWQGRNERPALVAVLVWMVLNGLSFLQLAKAGSAANYLLELDVAVAVGCGLAVGLVPAGGGTDAVPIWRRVLPSVLAVVLLVGATLQWHPLRRVATHPIPEEQSSDAELWTLLLTTSGDVLSELPIYTIAAGREVLYQPFIMQQLATEGRWNPEPFESDLRSRRFSLIVTTQSMDGSQPTPGWTPSMRSLIEEHYEPTKVLRTWMSPLVIYRPRP